MERLDGVDGETLDDDQKDDSTVISTEDGSDGDTSLGTFDLDAVLSGNAGTIDEDVGDDDDDSVADDVKTRRSSLYDLSDMDSNVKIIVIGSSGVGKTTLLHVLSGYPFDETTTDRTYFCNQMRHSRLLLVFSSLFSFHRCPHLVFFPL